MRARASRFAGRCTARISSRARSTSSYASRFSGGFAAARCCSRARELHGERRRCRARCGPGSRTPPCPRRRSAPTRAASLHRVGELDAHAQPPVRLAHAALHDVAHAELAADLLGRDGAVLVRLHRVVRDDADGREASSALITSSVRPSLKNSRLGRRCGWRRAAPRCSPPASAAPFDQPREGEQRRHDKHRDAAAQSTRRRGKAFCAAPRRSRSCRRRRRAPAGRCSSPAARRGRRSAVGLSRTCS